MIYLVVNTSVGQVMMPQLLLTQLETVELLLVVTRLLALILLLITVKNRLGH